MSRKTDLNAIAIRHIGNYSEGVPIGIYGIPSVSSVQKIMPSISDVLPIVDYDETLTLGEFDSAALELAPFRRFKEIIMERLGCLLRSPDLIVTSSRLAFYPGSRKMARLAQEEGFAWVPGHKRGVNPLENSVLGNHLKLIPHSSKGGLEIAVIEDIGHLLSNLDREGLGGNFLNHVIQHLNNNGHTISRANWFMLNRNFDGPKQFNLVRGTFEVFSN